MEKKIVCDEVRELTRKSFFIPWTDALGGSKGKEVTSSGLSPSRAEK